MHQTTHFFNLGYGWLCKHCSAEDAERKYHHHHQNHQHSSHHKATTLALARWCDEGHHGLMCPRCGIEEHFRRTFH